MKIVFYETKDWEEEYIRQRLPGQTLAFYGAACNEQLLPDADAEVLSIFVGSSVTKKVLENCPNLKLIVTRSTGYDHIDIKACAEKKVTVSYVPAYGDNTVAEFTFALLLMLAKKMYPAVKRVREEGWFSFENLRGFDLKGKTIGIVGTGRIGSYVAHIAQGFGMKILAYDPVPNELLAKQYGLRYVPMPELLAFSDVITLHVPYMSTTHHLINAGNINSLKKGCLLINTSRGGLVDTQSLVWALEKGIIAGAALDVLEEEGLIKDEIELLQTGHPKEYELRTLLENHELMHMDNVIITPHNAFNTLEALERILDTTIEDIASFSDGNSINVVKV